MCRNLKLFAVINDTVRKMFVKNIVQFIPHKQFFKTKTTVLMNTGIYNLKGHKSKFCAIIIRILLFMKPLKISSALVWIILNVIFCQLLIGS